jgi:hypothetical protein
LEAEALNIVHDTNKTTAAISERGSKDHIAHLLFRHDRFRSFRFVRRFMWRAAGNFAEVCWNLQKWPNRNWKNG